jgi:integrase
MAGLARWKSHVTGHTAVSLLIADGVPLRVVMEPLGHSQFSTTANTYNHVFAETVREAADAIDRALGTGSRFRRILSLPASAISALRAHRDRQAWERKAASPRWRESGMVFTTSLGTAIDPDNLTKVYKAMLNRAGLRDQRFHDLRHAAATLMPRDGPPVHEVSAVLGHSQTSTTLNVYSHVLPGGNDRAAAAMDRLLG